MELDGLLDDGIAAVLDGLASHHLIAIVDNTVRVAQHALDARLPVARQCLQC